MAFVLADRVLETSTSTGTGSFVLAGARDGYQSFTDALANGDTTYYTITDGTDWEVGLGTWTESSATLARTTVLSSSNSGSAVNFGAGTKEVFISYPADKAVFEDASGNIAIPGTIDGRDLAIDGTKLDGIESGATADQTAAEIRTLVDSATDSNVFTDADHTKLDGIEASADVTDTTNVTAAGALMDSEVTNLAQVKAFDSSDYATAAQGTTADAALPKTGGTMTGDITFNSGQTFDGRDVSVDGTRLDDNIIYNATNTNNVAGVWEASISDVTSYTDGLIIAFYPNKIDGASGGTTFEINSLGAKTIKRPDSSSNQITTHYDGSNLILLRYVSSDDQFIVHADYNSTDDYRIRWNGYVTANNSAGSGVAFHGYQLLMEGIDGKFYPVTEGGSTGNTNAVSTAEMRVGGTILSYESSTNVNANATTSWGRVYEGMTSGNMEYWNNRDSGWATTYRPIYLVATINSNGNFVLDNTSYTSFLTQDLPTSDDNKYYIRIGWMQDNYDDWRLEVNHPIYVYKNGAVREWSGYANNADLLDGNEATAFATAAQGTTADSALQNISEDTSPQLGGNLDTNGYEISFDDNKFAKFGASDDLQIGHFSALNANFIDSVSPLSISSDSSILFKQDDVAGANYVVMLPNGAVKLYYDNGQKFETTSTGIKAFGNIDVNGAYTLPTSDGSANQVLTTDGSGAVTFADVVKIKRTEFDLTPGTTTADINTSLDSNVYKYVFVIADTNTSSGPYLPTLNVKRIGTSASWTGTYAYTNGSDGTLPTGIDLWSGLTYYSAPADGIIIEIYRTTDRWIVDVSQGHGTAGFHFVRGYASNISRDYISNITLGTGTSYTWTKVQGHLLEYS